MKEDERRTYGNTQPDLERNALADQNADQLLRVSARQCLHRNGHMLIGSIEGNIDVTHSPGRGKLTNNCGERTELSGWKKTRDSEKTWLQTYEISAESPKNACV